MYSYLNRFRKYIFPKVLLTPINCLLNVKRSRNYDLKLNRGRSNKVGTYTDPILKKGRGELLHYSSSSKDLMLFSIQLSALKNPGSI